MGAHEDPCEPRGAQYGHGAMGPMGYGGGDPLAESKVPSGIASRNRYFEELRVLCRELRNSLTSEKGVQIHVCKYVPLSVNKNTIVKQKTKASPTYPYMFGKFLWHVDIRGCGRPCVNMWKYGRAHDILQDQMIKVGRRHVRPRDPRETERHHVRG